MKEERKNCWEYMKCGRELGGKNVEEMGCCPASTENIDDGLNNGKNSGRFCWTIAGTYCKGKIQGIYAQKLKDCMQCPFYKKVEEEEGRYLKLTPFNNIPKKI